MKNMLHLKAPGNWINDPNGFIYYQGMYHLFYQYFPYAPMWGTMHWGHAISKDLIHWEHLGVALYPTKEYDRNGVFSGSAMEIDNQLYLYYTAVRYVEERKDNIHLSSEKGSVQSQALLISPDGFQFDNLNAKRQILPPIEDSDIGDGKDCRDPKVWKENGIFYMCLGTTFRSQEGVLLIYESRDGICWELNSRIQDSSLGNVLECPDLFEVDGKQILIASPMKIMKDTEFPEDQTTIRFAHFEGKRKCLSMERDYRFFDYGMDLYAPQSNLDADGRRVVMAWVRMPHAIAPAYNDACGLRPWNGMMALPRVISVRNGHIYTSVHPNVRRFFEERAMQKIEHGNYREWVVDDQRRITMSLSEGDSVQVYEFQITMQNGCVHTDRSHVLEKGCKLHQRCVTPRVGEQCELEIYMEPHLIEVFINDGQYVITNVIHV